MAGVSNLRVRPQLKKQVPAALPSADIGVCLTNEWCDEGNGRCLRLEHHRGSVELDDESILGSSAVLNLCVASA